MQIIENKFVFLVIDEDERRLSFNFLYLAYQDIGNFFLLLVFLKKKVRIRSLIKQIIIDDNGLRELLIREMQSNGLNEKEVFVRDYQVQ